MHYLLFARTTRKRSVLAHGMNSYAYDNANRLTRLSHTTGGGSVTLGDYVFALDAVGNRTAITETVQVAGLGGMLRPVNGPVQILLPFVGNQAPAAQPTVGSTQNPILFPFLSNGGVGPSQARPTVWPRWPDLREPAQAPTNSAAATAMPTKTAVPKTAPPTQTTAPQVATLVPGKPRGELPAARLEQARAGASLLALAGVTETTTINYSYDRLYRVTGASYTGTLTNTFGYTYDAVGNRLTQTASGTVISYTYDIANRLTSVNGQAYTWDDNGNLLNDGAQTYTYDQANRLRTVVQGAITTTLAYNGVGDRLSQTVGITTTRYALDPAAGLTQVLADGTNTYLYGNGRLAQYQTAMQYFGADGLGSVRQIYDVSAQVVGSTRYDPYGSVLAQSGATSMFAFTGEQYDAGTGLEYLRARYYSAAQGRFVTRDTWEGDPNAPMSYNAWLYAYANSVNLTDPSGQVPLAPPIRRSCGCGLVGGGCEQFKGTPFYEPCKFIASIFESLSGGGQVSTPTPNPTETQAFITQVVVVTSTPLPLTPTLAPAVKGTPAYELAKMMYWEEKPYQGAMEAVGWVAVNRVGQRKNDTSRSNFPGTLQGVLDEPEQFQGYLKYKDLDVPEEVSRKTPDPRAKVAWEYALANAPAITQRRGTDPTESCMWFGNGSTVLNQMKYCQGIVPTFKYKTFDAGARPLYTSNLAYNYCDLLKPTPTRTSP